MTKIDPYKHEQRYKTWKEKANTNGIQGISQKNSDLILKYLFDMENGLNVSVSSKKGARSYPRLNNLKQRLVFLSKEFEKRQGIDFIGNLNQGLITKYFNDLRSGEIRRLDGKIYKSVGDYIKVFKAFWHWHMLVNQSEDIQDITIYLDASTPKPKWVYLDEEQIRKLCDYASFDYEVLIMFLLDTGIRSPSELMNIKVSDVYFDKKELNISDEASKTFGRRIKLMLCGDLLKKYIKDKKLENNNYIFQINPSVVNKYLKRLGKKVFGEVDSLAGDKYSDLTMYDFRHCSCCYWLPRYKSESALKYRFGWKKSDKIHYYSELLGMKDTITEEDLLIDVTKTEIEKRLIKTEQENSMIKEQMKIMEEKMKEIETLTDRIHEHKDHFSKT